jgi:NAD(P)H-flavin reductase
MNCGIMEENIDKPTQKLIGCIDAGSENCPCYLAVTGDCLICSRLQGKNYCNCDWRGVCIYNEFIQGNRKVNNPRRDFEARIIQRKFYQEDLVVYILDVGKGFAMKAERPGSYLFIRGSGTSNFYDIPISVMHTDVEKGQIHLGVKIISSKTKALLAEKEKLTLRGPYRNGLHGISTIVKKKGKNFKTLIVTKGIGIAPGILASRSLQYKGTVDMVVDTEKISKELIEDYLEEGPAVIRYLSLTDKDSMKELAALMKKNQYDNVILLVSDYFIDQLGRRTKKILPAADLAVSNNFRICCGEGLCGSCSVGTSDGDTIKMCKCQLNGEDFLKHVFYTGV